jgi:hypothetical protein
MRSLTGILSSVQFVRKLVKNALICFFFVNKKVWEELIAYFPVLRYCPHKNEESKGIYRQQDGVISIKNVRIRRHRWTDSKVIS